MVNKTAVMAASDALLGIYDGGIERDGKEGNVVTGPSAAILAMDSSVDQSVPSYLLTEISSLTKFGTIDWLDRQLR